MVIILMGISGCGKSTVGTLLANRLGMHFAEGDTYHPPENVAKMSAGHALTDADRLPWLRRMAADITEWSRQGRPAVLSCSALKKAYRVILQGDNPDIRVVHLHGPADLVRARMALRRDHFMPPSLIDSQLATLELPAGEPNVLTLDISASPDEIVEAIVSEFQLVPASVSG